MDPDDYISPADEAAYLDYQAWRAGQLARPESLDDSGEYIPDPTIPF